MDFVMSETGPARRSYNVGLIVASYLVSLIGSLLAFELLQRRTSVHGLINW